MYQHGTLGALIAGQLQGTTTISDVLTHGDFGIGTLEGSDGEVIFIDNQAYHASSDGAFQKLSGEELTPFATITQFETQQCFNVQSMMDGEAVFNKAREIAMSENLFFAIKITGHFKNIRVRMIPKQTPPYKRLSEVAQHQPEYTREDINGTIVGFYSPQLFHGIASGGFHVHFISDSQDFGGHVLDFEVESGEVEIKNEDTLEQHLPIDNERFLAANIDYSNIAQEISDTE
ncbi:acetolactate decarboxylase [Staphylococcus sp. SQ8-PEA]|uniref:Alpha-acetolactate decarboxylase n=1 Tax=Staphylococcus marylandisciuri TaxID=2981529 RepID=A0ABT2QMX5_9STAP|nr:acetolactate decarboxylase [Staphylococcus marylandisciuri]MCU5745328.1 acetolactate decarboxylase [Staphylococcus marylandisciuri]